ncbi:MAG TPA: response regulator [Gammaproteobacteria bacterium]
MTDAVATETAETRPRILLADDSRVIRTSAARILGDEFEVLLAVDGQDAWDQLRQHDDICAVFTDIGMPYIDGLALLAKIRGHEDEGFSALPVIVVTGDETDEAREDALKRGATDFITKPFNRVDLLARARSHATSQRERRELAAYTTIDRLTRLGNEQHFLASLRDARSFSARHGQPFSVLRLHIDGLKGVVQKIGKETFLRRMRELGAVIKACIRNEDTAARLEAVHFAIITPVCDADGARKLAKRIQATVAAAGKRAGWDLPLTLSIGISTPSLFPDAEFETMTRDLASAARAAEANGAGSIVVSSATREAGGGGSAPMEVGSALKLLAEGHDERVKTQLPRLLEKLAPLLKFARKTDAELLKKILNS